MANDDQIVLPKVTCTSTKCDEGLHCFRPKKGKVKVEDYQGGKCQACDADIVDWNRIYSRDLDDVDTLFAALRKEYVRHVFWTIQLDLKVSWKKFQTGRVKMEEAVYKRLQRSVSCSGRESIWDGRQTPMTPKNIIYCAQHATATCCRKCIRYWHNIPYDRDLTDSELQYLTGLVMHYIDIRLFDNPPVGTQLVLPLS
ncbi:DUF4186 family protein [Rudanella lutea]|uniref:DUF4186 family protein n=1 Tax=Rudanella lutea TaxID=451374 RepID=UPI00036C381E|nr:DUF4186 family protein [Rudanella lutea]